MRNFSFYVTSIIFSIFFYNQSNCQSFTLDDSYSVNGKQDIIATCNNSLLLNNDKMLIAYGFSTENTLRVEKHNSDGSIDNTFGLNGIGKFISPNTYPSIYINDSFEVNAITSQTDGKIIVAGTMRFYYSSSYLFDFFLVRFNSDGSVDNSFGTNGLVRQSINTRWGLRELFNDIKIDQNDKILVVGYTLNNLDETGDAVSMRFLPNGTIDNTYANNGILRLNLVESDYFRQVIILNDNSILIAGNYTISSTNRDLLVMKLNENGVIDTTFGNNGITTIDFDLGIDTTTKMFLKPDNKIVIVGTSIVNTLSSRIAFAQLNSDGNLDPTFNVDGKNTVYGYVLNHNSVGAQNVLLMPNNKYLIFSSSTRNDNSTNNYDLSVFRINEDTTLDTTFGNNGVLTNITTNNSEYAYGIQCQTDEKILLFVNYWGASGTHFGYVERYLNTNPLGINDFTEATNDINIFPNPVIDDLQIVSKNNIEKVEIYNTTGQKIKTVIPIFNHLNLSNTEKGVLFLKIYSDNTTYNYKIIKN